MYYGEIKTTDIANGPGVRTTLFVSGCRHHCEGCFQPQTWDFHYGEPFTVETIKYILETLEPAYVKGLTLLGGEPFEPENQRDLIPLLRQVKERYPNKDVWCFSGYRLEELAGWDETSAEESEHAKECARKNPPRGDLTDEMLSLIDVLVDGEFELENKSLSLQFRGSTNQRIIKVQESLEAGEVIIWTDERSLESIIRNQK